MSFDLIAWKKPAVTTEEEARALVDRYYAKEHGVDPAVFEPSEDLLRFYDAVLARFPALEDFDDDARLAGTPWSTTPERSDRVIELTLRWRAPDAALDAIVDLARQHGLVLYDPQGPSLHAPDTARPRDVAGQARQAVVAGALGVALLAAGASVPYRLLSWPLLGVGLFLVVASIYTLVVLWRPGWEPD